MSLSNTMLQFDNWGDEFKFSGDEVVFAWDGQKKYYTDKNNYQDLVWIKTKEATRKAISADYRKNSREKNNRQIFGVDDANDFYEIVLEAAGLLTVFDNEPSRTPGDETYRNQRLRVGVNLNQVSDVYRLPNRYFDPLATIGTPFYGFAKYGAFSAFEINLKFNGGGRVLRFATPAYFESSREYLSKIAYSDRVIYPGVMQMNNFEFVVTDPLIWEITNENAFLINPECCA